MKKLDQSKVEYIVAEKRTGTKARVHVPYLLKREAGMVGHILSVN